MIDLKKIETFTKVAEAEIEELTTKVAAAQATIIELKTKIANLEARDANLADELKKAAAAMYEADFITDDKGQDFMKRAAQNPAYLAKVIVNLCKASEVASMGKLSSVTVRKPVLNDPVAARAFGDSFADVSTITDVTE